MMNHTPEYDAVVEEMKAMFGEKRAADAGTIRKRAEAEAAALQAVNEAYAEMIKTLFSNASVRYGNEKEAQEELKDSVEEFADESYKFAKALGGDDDPSGLRDDARSAASSTAKRTVGSNPLDLGKRHAAQLMGLAESEVSQIAADIGADVFMEMGSSLIPIIGEIKDGVNVVRRWAEVAHEEHLIRRTQRANERAVRQGDPRLAIKAVCRLLERERNRLATEASISTTKFGMSILSDFVDLGTATKSATAVAMAAVQLTQRFYEYGRDKGEVVAAQQALHAARRTGKLDASLFEACPLFGAYMVTCAPTSYLVGMLSGPNYAMSVDSMEEIIRVHIHPLQKEARLLIEKSNISVSGLPSNRGQFVALSDRSLKERLKIKIKTKLKEKGMSAAKAIKNKASQAKKHLASARS